MKNLFTFLVALIVVSLVVAGLVVFGAHPEWLAWSVAFFDGFTAEQLIGTAVVAVLWLWPSAGVAIVNTIKERVGLEGDQAHKAVILILAAFSVVVMLITGAFTDSQFTFEALLFYFGEAYFLSQYTYKRLTAAE